MKKIYALLLTVLMMFSLTACNAVNEDSGSVFAPLVVSTTDESMTSSKDNSADNSSDSTSQTASTDSSTTENSSAANSSSTESAQPALQKILCKSRSDQAKCSLQSKRNLGFPLNCMVPAS